MQLLINPKAELKIRIAMKHAKLNEIMWFGEIKKTKQGNFILKDIHFPPQINQPIHVTTDDDKYPQWSFNKFTKTNKAKDIRLHGHTHPFFSTSPSSIDDDHTKMFLEETGDYYIQMILSNVHQPYCMYHDLKGSKPIEIVWDYTVKIKKILLEVMQNEPEQT